MRKAQRNRAEKFKKHLNNRRMSDWAVLGATGHTVFRGAKFLVPFFCCCPCAHVWAPSLAFLWSDLLGVIRYVLKLVDDEDSKSTHGISYRRPAPPDQRSAASLAVARHGFDRRVDGVGPSPCRVPAADALPSRGPVTPSVKCHGTDSGYICRVSVLRPKWSRGPVWDCSWPDKATRT